MLGPDSRLLTALLIIVSAALLAAVIRFRLLPVKILCGALSIMVAMVGGVAAVNYYYGYYTTWGELWADFHGGTGDLGTVAAATSTSAVESGRIGWANLPGKLSGYDRRALVYLPPQYGQPQYARVRFPVVELFHGTPGSPLAWDTVLRIDKVVNLLIAKHEIGPVILVMPSINGSGHNYQDCVNGPSVNDDTYLTKDVRADMFAHYRVSHDPYEWGVAGYSSGGYCAANLALRHRGSFGAAAIIEGYFRAADGPAAKALNYSQPLEVANSPLYLAERLTASTTSPLPAFWIAAGVHDSDYKPAGVFAAAMDRMERVPMFRLNANDTANAWAAALPAALTWMWQQLAPPDLRVLFPARGQAVNAITLPVLPVKTHHRGSCKVAVGYACAPLSTGKGKQAEIQTSSRLAAAELLSALHPLMQAAIGALDRAGHGGGDLGRGIRLLQGTAVLRVLDDDHGATRPGEDGPGDARHVRMRTGPPGHVLLCSDMRDLGDPGDHGVSPFGGAQVSTPWPCEDG